MVTVNTDWSHLVAVALCVRRGDCVSHRPLASMSRPGVTKVMDPTLATLLAVGDEVIPSVPPGLNLLHVALKVTVTEPPPPVTEPPPPVTEPPPLVPVTEKPPPVTEKPPPVTKKPPPVTKRPPPEETLPSSDDDDDGAKSDPEEVIAQEERLEQRFRVLKRKEGIDSERTLKAAFKLMDCLIGQYKLNRTDDVLREVAPACKARAGDWHMKYIQSTAFVRWKQYKFKEALDLFLEQQVCRPPPPPHTFA